MSAHIEPIDKSHCIHCVFSGEDGCLLSALTRAPPNPICIRLSRASARKIRSKRRAPAADELFSSCVGCVVSIDTFGCAAAHAASVVKTKQKYAVKR